MMRVIIAAGGTGGHIYPGIAVAQEIMRRDAESRVRFIGTKGKLEEKLVPNAGFELSLVESAGLKNVGLLGQLRGLSLIPKTMLAARKIIKDFQPHVVVGAGGYVTGATLLAAWMSGVPTLVMDSNALPGWTNRKLAMVCTKAAVAFEEALPYFKGKAVVTGNPVRREFFEIPAERADDGEFSVLIFGGSQGARAINDAMLAALPHLENTRREIRMTVTHQTGMSDFERIEAGYKDAGWMDADVRPYLDEMVAHFANADLIISRAGATTSAELIAAGRAAIMIPLPTAADDHQRKNAEALMRGGAAHMILQSDLTGETLAREINRLARAPHTIHEMETSARRMSHRDAAERTVDLLEQMLEVGG